MQAKLLAIYQRLYHTWGPQKWWPAESAFEVIIGAILTQAVNWSNVERAIANLKAAGVMDPKGLCNMPEERLAELIKPSGYYQAKARKIKSFVSFLMNRYGGSLQELFSQPLAKLRPELLSVWGIGPETADSILLYAGGYPVFVVDAYTKRIMSRLGLAPIETTYGELQALFMENLPRDPRLFNEYHALLIRLGKGYCKKNNPRCGDCPLADLCAGALE